MQNRINDLIAAKVSAWQSGDWHTAAQIEQQIDMIANGGTVHDMQVLRAAQSQTALGGALIYQQSGFSVIPCQGKAPATVANRGGRASAFGWRRFTEEHPTPWAIRSWHDRGWLENVAIICGDVSTNLVVIDLDGEEAIAAFKAEFAELTDTYTVRTGSGVGQHLYFYVQRLPATTRVTGSTVGNVELRANGTYIIAPPSIHPQTGRQYRVERAAPIALIPHMRRVQAWIKDLMKEKHGGVLPAPTGTARTAVHNGSRWAQAALDNEARSVATALKNTRNNTLNRAAFKLGQLIATGDLPRTQVEAVLTSAAAHLAADDGELSVERTIRSGIEAGLKSPRKRITASHE